jgi:hypothetical protein
MYLQQATNIDKMIEELWYFVQTSSFYGNKTTLLSQQTMAAVIKQEPGLNTASYKRIWRNVAVITGLLLGEGKISRPVKTSASVTDFRNAIDAKNNAARLVCPKRWL